ncbi:MAG: hypothetical protein HQK96_11380 [Nitrospirae bacterium]|uniref:hypothetical protein n=1 Tax=Candidatus Magnetominusculus dajiuhuensis TaxID=3137712 RepID=UPI001A068448|nr:hypothetical protein [Nitrospirota bacterium]
MMNKKMTETFDRLLELASDFVERQKGTWDHTTWLGFLDEVQKKGIELTTDMERYVGLVLETLKKVYNASTNIDGIRNVMIDMSSQTADFVKKTRGVWNQSDGEVFLKELRQKGLNLNEDMMSYFGGVLEAVKGIYASINKSPDRNKTPDTDKK